MERDAIVGWLREVDAGRLERLWREADRARRESVGDEVHLRGLVEISNHCVRQCLYCGLRADHHQLARYRMTAEEILACARTAAGYGYGTLVLQAGEDRALSAEWVAALVRRVKAETGLAVTLSLGERSERELELWRQAGADRYLLRFETSNRDLFNRIHPPHGDRPSDRLALLAALGRLGYEVGSGVMVGLPGQSWSDLAADLELLRALDLDMIGVGPYLPHPATPLGRHRAALSVAAAEQVPNDELTTLKVVALARLLCPRTNIPATTALATVSPGRGRENALERGANVVMPNLTPEPYRAAYEIYPGKACVSEAAAACHGCLARRVATIGRRVGSGRGDSPARAARVRVRGEETTP